MHLKIRFSQWEEIGRRCLQETGRRATGIACIAGIPRMSLHDTLDKDVKLRCYVDAGCARALKGCRKRGECKRYAYGHAPRITEDGCRLCHFRSAWLHLLARGAQSFDGTEAT